MKETTGTPIWGCPAECKRFKLVPVKCRYSNETVILLYAVYMYPLHKCDKLIMGRLYMSTCFIYETNSRGAVVPVLNELSTTPWRRVGEWTYRCTFSWPRHYLEVSGHPRYPLDRRLGEPQSRSGRFGEEKILDPIGTRTPTPQSSSP
jgi:hypothetical protein